MTTRPTGASALSARGPMRASRADVEQLREHPVPTSRILNLFRPYAGRVAVVSVLILVTSLVGLAQPFLVRRAIDDAIPGQDVPLLVWIVVGMIAITVISSVLGIAQTWIATDVGQSIMHRLRTGVFTHLQRMPLDFFTRTRGGRCNRASPMTSMGCSRS